MATAVIPAHIASRATKTAAPVQAKGQDMTALLLAEIEALKAQVATAQAQVAAKSAPRAITYKVSEKGALSMYGFGRFPVTLYKGQMLRLVEEVKSGRVEKAIAQFEGQLLVKE